MRSVHPSHSPLPFLLRRRRLHLSATMSTSSSPGDSSAQQQILRYHNRTKHALPAHFAPGPRNLDWANQPNPFLIHPTPAPIPLSHTHPPSPSYLSLFSTHSTETKPTLSQLLYDSLSLSAWKSTGISTWPLRVNPSSGNLHPTETHVISGPTLNIPKPFLAHYNPKTHSLEIRAFFSNPHSTNDTLINLLNEGSVVMIVFSSVFWREAWKYGERGFRYCNHDVGHAIGAVTVAAKAAGWDARLIHGFGDDEIRSLLGLGQSTYYALPRDRARGRFPWVEEQHTDCVMVLFPIGMTTDVDYDGVVNYLSGSEWVGGKAEELSKEHVFWEEIYRVAEAVKKPRTDGKFVVNPFRASKLIGEGLYKDMTVREVVRKRRSAVDMDGVYVMKREVFYQILLHCLPSGELGEGERQGEQLAVPFRVLTWDAEVHAVLFVHRVDGLAPGLYFLVRNEGHLEDLKRAMRDEFKWERPEGCPDGLPLYRLARGDCRELAKQLSCHQDIAADGCFSLGMVARFAPVIEKNAWMYPRLFWETGVLGQVLYLEAHAVGISATGIGCYFDDGVHQVLGLKDSEFQSLYHFTVGNPVVDKRIMSLPAYPGPEILDG